MKAVTQAIIFTAAFLAACGLGRASFAQAPTVTVMVRPSPIPIPLTVVRGTLVVFQGPISQQMTLTTFALRNDYGEFAKGDFLDSWKLMWNTAVEHDATEQIAVYWSRAGGPVTRLTRYNVKFVEATPFTIKAENAGGKTTVTITPTGTLTAQKFNVSLDGAATGIVIDSQGKGVIDTTFFRSGAHMVGATAVMTDGSVSAIAPVSFFVPYPPRPTAVPVHHKPVSPTTVKHKPAHSGKPRHG